MVRRGPSYALGQMWYTWARLKDQGRLYEADILLGRCWYGKHGVLSHQEIPSSIILTNINRQ